MGAVLLFGSFDPLHEGHLDLFRQAASLGDQLTVVVARDNAIRLLKHREPRHPEEARLQAVADADYVDVALLGDDDPTSWDLLDALEFDVLALGYDQEPNDEEVVADLDRRGKGAVEVVRLNSYKPDVYKSSKS